MNQYLKRILALALTLLIIIGGYVQSTWAEEIVPEEIAVEYSLPEEFASGETPEEEYVAEEPAVEEPIVEETPIVEEEPLIVEEKPTEAPAEVPWTEEPVVYDTETGYPLLEMIIPLLNADEILEIQDEIIHAGDPFDLTDPHWLDFGEDTPAPFDVQIFKVVGSGGDNFPAPGVYTVYYVVTPTSGNPAYEISRIITVLNAGIPDDESPEEEPPIADDPASADDETEENASEDNQESEDVPATDTGEAPREDEPFPSAPTETVDTNTPEPGYEEAPADAPDTPDVPAAADTPDVPAAQPPADAADATQDGASENPSADTLTAAATEAPAEGDDEDDDDIAPDNIVIEGPAKVTRGSKIKYPSDLGSSYSTFQYYVDGKFAYCLEADRSSPKSGSFAQEILESNPGLIKALYYGYGGPGDISAAYYPNYSGNVRTVLTHIAVSYFYTGSLSRATKGCSSSGVKKYDIEGWINYLKELPDPPSPKISLSDKTLEVVSISDGIQTTGTTTLNADSRNSITVTLPDEITYHNQDTGEAQTGGSIQINGGTTFYFSAPASLNGTWRTDDLKGAISHIWKALVITTGTKTQNLGSYASETYGGSVHFSVDWLGQKTLTLTKVDSKDNEVHLANAVIGVYADAECTNLLATLTTGADGTASCTLPADTETVYLKELTAPDGYWLNGDVHAVDMNASHITILFENEKKPDGGKIAVLKEGEVLSGYENGQFIYENRRLPGVTFEVYADGALVATLVTDENGEACTEVLPFGTYTVVEKLAADGYVLDGEAHTVTLSCPDADMPVLVSTLSLHNQRQRYSVSVEKQNADGTVKLPSAGFALYAGSDIAVGNTLLVAAGTCLATGETDDSGKLTFDLDLPMGSYLIGETKAPDGYLLSEEVQAVEVTAQGQDTAAFEFKAVFKDNPTRIAISKVDATTGVELDGASLTLLDSENRIIDSWTSVANKPHIVEGLKIGATYTLREEIAPYGYLITNSVQFTVSETSEVQKVEMRDEVPTGTIIISKTGEFLSDVSALDAAAGQVGNAFDYITGKLKDVTFGVYAYEAIRHADGVSPDYYAAGELVATITTDSSGIAQISDLPLGKYYVQEIATQNGYVLDNEPRMINLTYRDANTKVVTYSEDWQNERQKASVKVYKRDSATSAPLEGAVFGLFTAEDIVSNSRVIMEKDTLIEQRATDSTGSLSFKADLPVGFSYYVKELVPPDGYSCNSEDVYTFSFSGSSADQVFEFVCMDDLTQVDFTKTSLTTGEAIEGAHLQVSDMDGNIIDSWISEKTEHRITGLTVGKTYTLTETLPANGYVTAESVTFTIENSGQVQKVEMKDDVTRVQISKTDLGGNELEGAKLTILDSAGKVVDSWISGKEPHYIEMLPIGKYTLREESAPNGYTVAEDISFEVLDTGEIQKVVMKDAPVNKPDTPTGGSGTPKTGDVRKPIVWALAGGIGVIGIGAALLMLRRRKK